ncbi:MAG: hypothetical protein A3C50_01245 [Candidatus Staskawiczbacteria bacterium RIFCSPHIGHO2_02_FULL_43_16]|uniref:DUF5659 domain-containing protein n=1 Tax=Candidatus Staskawiczbacteria bacterium RIFCSPHIGHO2_01_FULL_41_41 TaxID=1802203 RepID=A0A1G2HV39_9BACT|nr:MAG: hypothetical protein A2822_04670 [Candidatus Staskawiczbacteria bacterium RIFCSPHIGHO2_01_FULL_41_41]OGZ68834.1 MAG: hypothetical protein A3C50_01245 [Candidatus Staskawiczbacteria bacterium RIFCSPHIGHO2_02_FULL_43_16]OGZ74207.1 MAG: hypothetical protein A3A12_00235 [Candidatus Staskawiczbacteria bacterium RIFCSPLOWO2_01_FULL_43_17b]
MTKKLHKNQTEKVIPLEIDSSKVLTTFDLGCAAALATAGFELLSLDRENPRKVKFIFRRSAGIENTAEDFWSDRLEQKSRSFWDNTKNLKNRLYSND